MLLIGGLNLWIRPPRKGEVNGEVKGEKKTEFTEKVRGKEVVA